jgi:hypothetical protein
MRVLGYVGSASLCFGLVASVALSGATAAETDFRAAQGAWLEPGLSCEAVFAHTGKGIAFRRPVDIFAPAFILSGDRLTTPQAICRIRSSKPAEGRRILSLDCANRVAVGDVTLRMSLSDDGSLRRYFDDEDQVGRAYKRCT